MTERTNGDVERIREERIRELLTAEADQPMVWWYLSYADARKFRGGLIIEARGFASAVLAANLTYQSPGGEVRGLQIPDEELPPEKYRNHLLTVDELNEFWTMEKLSTLDEEQDAKERPDAGRKED